VESAAAAATSAELPGSSDEGGGLPRGSTDSLDSLVRLGTAGASCTRAQLPLTAASEEVGPDAAEEEDDGSPRKYSVDDARFEG
jgi:hypothetical protein